MIPKIIHYCWLSNDPVPEKLQHCMETWKKILPDYEWVKWDLNRFDINSNVWAKEAFEKKKYAFAADYIRLYAIYTMGGIYMDMDVEVIKSFDDFLDNDFFTFSEYYPEWYKKFNCDQYTDAEGHRIKGEEVLCFSLQAAVLGAEKGSRHVKELMSFYEHNHFLKPDGTLNMRPLAPGRYAVVAENWGFVYRDVEQKLPDRVTIYPSKYVACVTGYRCDDSYAVHHCAHSWADPPKNKNMLQRVKQKCKEFLKSFVR